MQSSSIVGARAVLIIGGILLMLVGAYQLVTTQRIDQLFGLALWMLGAIVLHDGILSPIVLFANVLLKRSGRRMPWSVLVVIQIAVVVGSVLTLIVVPEIAGQLRGPANPTILTGDYGLRLAVMWGVLLVIAAIISAVLVRRGKRPADELVKPAAV
ncbi:hypothetical protein [Naasia lichenicola]|uniref:Uncharacterized protein n=1 Tax=Naasia lichenicola TaxID=2565933 RepID=A0A4S4FJY8_9MICO|nr:hypothetical protein [Naasia lichenicola]THG30172.1 hypothetical protein E6C64_16230 [Naasia lichenicola]